MAYYRYPYEAITDKTDYLQITVKKYAQNDALVENAFSFGIASQATTVSGNPGQVGVAKVGDVIILPMPSNIQDSNAASYGEDNLDILGAAAGSIAMGLMESGRDAASKDLAGAAKVVGDKFAQYFKKGGNVSEIAISAFTRQLAASAAGLIGANVTAEQLLTRSTGKILNPNMELLFRGPTLRQFQFQFKMTPRDENESYQIKSIIRSFKANMAPIISKSESAANQTGAGSELAGQAYLSTPNIFELQYRKGNRNHPFLNRFKQCALTSMSVNYTGEGVYATYADATPVSMILTLAFQELVPIYSSDYYKSISSDGKPTEFSDSDFTYKKDGETEGVGY